MNRPFIPLSRPWLSPAVHAKIGEVLESGRLSGDGPVCRSVEDRIRRLFGIRHALLTSSCTHALEMAAAMLGLRRGDEVVMPSFTFVSTANAVLRAGGKPVFCEINDRTLTLDPTDVERRVTPRTKAIIAVHYAGVAAEMEAIRQIALARNIAVIEDAAQGVNARYRGVPLGTIGDMGAFSFHDTKNYTSGEGGAFLTNDGELSRKGEIFREKGTNRANFLRGQVDKYTWVDEGSSFILSDVLAAILAVQLDELEPIQEGRRRVHELYMEGFRDLEQQGVVRLPVIPPDRQSNYHIFYLLVENEATRDMLIHRLKECGIGSAFHYVPLHSAPYARRMLDTADLDLPVTDRTFRTLIRLPIYPQLGSSEVGYVVESVVNVLKPVRKSRPVPGR